LSEEREITAKFLVEDLQSGWDEKAMPSELTARLLIGARTDLGRVRENNEDKFEFYIPSGPAAQGAKGSLVAVADGMGGHAAGQIASELGLKTLIQRYFADTHADVPGALRMAVREANAVVYDTASIPGRDGMGTTLTAAVVRGPRLYIAQVGDSRLYLLHGETLEQVTEDHSWVAEQVRRGLLTEDEAQYSPFRNVITRSLGNQPEVEPDIIERDVCAGDTLLLCSDGLSGVVQREEMEKALLSQGPSEACQSLVDLALERGGPDNATVLVARIEEMLSVAAGESVTVPPACAAEPAQPEQRSTSKEGKKRRGWFHRDE
jgi:protein phosphatase